MRPDNPGVQRTPVSRKDHRSLALWAAAGTAFATERTWQRRPLPARLRPVAFPPSTLDTGRRGA